MAQLAPGVHSFQAPQRFLGLELGTRMTVIQTQQGLWLHSPIAMDPSELSDLGELRWVMAPNLFHHLYVGPWIDQGLDAFAAPGLDAKRPDLRFAGILSHDGFTLIAFDPGTRIKEDQFLFGFEIDLAFV